MSERTRLSHLSNWIMTGCGIWLVSLGAYFIVLRPPRLPEDPRFMGAPLAPLRVAAPGLERWLHIVFTGMVGAASGPLRQRTIRGYFG